MMHLRSLLAALAVAVCAADSLPPVFEPPTADCDFALELVILQDASDSFANDIPNLKIQLPAVLDAIQVAHPESRFAYYSFVDKPVEPFGWPNDYCWKEMSPFSDDISKIRMGIDALVPGGGYDWPEQLLSAIQHAALSPAIGWNPSMQTETGRPIARVVLSITDAPYHVAGHGLMLGLYVNDGDEVLDCENEDYPSVTQVKKAIDNNNIFAGFLVANDPRVPGVDIINVYEELAEAIHGIDGVAVANIEEDGAELAAGIVSILEKLNKRLCPTAVPTQPPYPSDVPTVTRLMDDCAYTYEVAFQMDLSHSYTNELMMAKTAAVDVFGKMQQYYPGTIGAAVSHSDKPIPEFGFSVSQDYCHWVHQGMTDDSVAFENAFGGMSTRSGWDWNENQIESGMHAVLSGNTGWSYLPVKDIGGGLMKEVKRVLIVMTDSGYHKAGDGLSAGLVPNNGDDILSCLEEDYPSEEQFVDAMKKTDTAVAFMVPYGISPSHIDPVPVYYKLAQLLDDNGVPNMVLDIAGDANDHAHTISVVTDTDCIPSSAIPSSATHAAPARVAPRDDGRQRLLRGAEPPMQPMIVFGGL